MGDSDVYLGLEPSLFSPFKQIEMIEVFLFWIVLGLIPITLVRLFVTAYLQDKRGDQLDLSLIHISFVFLPSPFFNPQEVNFGLLFKLVKLFHCK